MPILIRIVLVVVIEQGAYPIDEDETSCVLTMTASRNAVWIAMENSSRIRLFHPDTIHENSPLVAEVKVAGAVNKMLAHCDDIIRQHKAACLRITALLTVKDSVLFVGTSAGVVLTMALPYIGPKPQAGGARGRPIAAHHGQRPRPFGKGAIFDMRRRFFVFTTVHRAK